jgi:4-hydroxyphenylpyruvate dioxygenase
VAAADHPALGICIDSFHILSRHHDPEGIREIPGDKIFFLQLADAPELVMDVLQWSRHYRCFPGQGGFDLTAFVGHVLSAGYRGPLSLEVFNDVFRQADAERTAVDAMRSLLVLEESLRTSASAERAFVDVDLCAPPAPVEPAGFAFAEIAVDHTSARAVERELTTLGFVRSGYHRSKPVHLWTQGRARVLLNHSDARVAGDLQGDALVSALALEVNDPEQAAARADQLCAPRIARDHGPSEADLAAVSAPDGTAVFFCRTAATDAQSWVTDFLPAEQPTAPAPTGITHIDHVGLAQPFDHFDEALLFYRSVLGLRRQGGQELAAPYGLVRSRPLSSADGAVRIALSVALLGRGGSIRGAPEPQQIAFACDDIFAASRAVRAAGGELLPIPDNYYDDLAARTDLDDALVARMRESSVLHDHTERGAFLHFYTRLIGRRLFLEVVQRDRGYDGYGAPNTPVRMAALRAAAHD